MQLVDPKPFGAFIEYTLKPILDEVREILELCDNDYKSIQKAFYQAIFIFIFDRILSALVTITVVGLICWTVLTILSHSQAIPQ